MSAEYRSSIFFRNLTSLTLTGNGASDVLMVAMSQLGYHEGNSTKDFGGKSASGSRNFVEYNRLSGKLDNNEGNGVSYGYAWCASFVTWCLRMAGVPKSDSGGEVSCSRWIREFLKPAELWEPSPAAGGTYTPTAGDLIFFRRSGSTALSTHVGLVLYTDATYVYTVEGNTSGGCVGTAKYRKDSTYIIGYGTPRYQSGGKITCDYAKSGTVTGHYIVTASDLNVRAAATTASKVVGGLKRSELVTVRGVRSGFAEIETEKGTGYAALKYMTLVATVPEADPEPTETEKVPEEPPKETEEAPAVTEGLPAGSEETPEITEDAPEATGETPEITEDAPESTGEAPENTEDAPEDTGENTEASGVTAAAPSDPSAGGCGSVIGASVALIALALIAPAGIVLKKKDEA